ncbi:hypothetical protein RvY_05188 [Ramazzottius varieornatus]|uniref:Signal peptidase complex subunit 1 n=1 Tax=Ramazzottius varieornatus TaxID=947166 RepID=A0A1D1UXT6_RAMVA|nr:hypothetical protein RvY_05188 [Ramazzottius varieornatus]
MSLASITDWFKFEWAYMDYEGQKSSERLYQRTILLAAAVGFVVGYYFQQFSYTVGALGVGSILSAILCGIPWPTFRKHPLKWQPVRDAEENGDPADVQNDAKKTSVDAKKKKKQK